LSETQAGQQSGVYLAAFLAPFSQWLQRDDVTDILVNRPGEVWVETAGGGLERHVAPDITTVNLTRLAAQIARVSRQGVSRESPLLSAALPTGERIQIVLPSATRGDVALAIRKHVLNDLTLDDYVSSGALDETSTMLTGPARDAVGEAMAAAISRGDIPGFLRVAVAGRRNILVAGGTGTGKTTFLNALLKEVPADERIIMIEDAPEIRLTQQNAVGLVASKGETGEARVGVEDLLQAALRMRPDRIIVGELRGAEALTFLRAINTGHPGSVSTVHADNPQGALDQIALMSLQAGTALTHRDVMAYARSVVDVIVQLERVHGRRRVREVHLVKGPG
jgi:type IV secretion system protein VirB11